MADPSRLQWEGLKHIAYIKNEYKIATVSKTTFSKLK